MITISVIVFLIIPVLCRLSYEMGRRNARISMAYKRTVAFDRGQESGFARGQVEGYKKGFADGEAKGNKDGEAKGFADGKRYGAAQKYNEEALRAMGLEFGDDINLKPNLK